MSSSRRHRHQSRGNRPPPAPLQSPQFSTAWSEWTFDERYNCLVRCRQIAATGVPQNDYEYEFSQSRQTEAPRGQASDPATALAAFSHSTAAQEPAQEYEQESSYTLNPVASVTRDFDRTKLSTVSEGPASTSNFAVNYNQGAGGSSSLNAGPSTYSPRGEGGFVNRHVRTRDDTTNVDLDPAYKVRPSRDFIFGRVFKVLWSEPKGSAGTEITKYRNAKFGEKAYDSIRRFVVVDDRHDGHCLCLPILTYGGQGTLKRGVHASTHAAIYTSKPVVKEGEKMTKKPIKMIPDNERDKLDPFSRINYAKVYTVEHNVKVNFIGKIAAKYEQVVTVDYNNTHRPLPDRIYPGDNTDDDFVYAQGPDPQYAAGPSQPATTTSWSPQVPVQTQNYTAFHPSTTMTSSYVAPVTSGSSDLELSFTSQATYSPLTISSHTYPLSYDSSAALGDQTDVAGAQTQTFNTASVYSPGSVVGEGTEHTAEETEAVEPHYEAVEAPCDDTH